jgi:hypothetical protein
LGLDTQNSIRLSSDFFLLSLPYPLPAFAECPVREDGDNQPAQALVEFERLLVRDPNRFWGILGAARAAEALGNHKAAKYYTELQVLTADRDTKRPELTHAKEVLAMQ